VTETRTFVLHMFGAAARRHDPSLSSRLELRHLLKYDRRALRATYRLLRAGKSPDGSRFVLWRLVSAGNYMVSTSGGRRHTYGHLESSSSAPVAPASAVPAAVTTSPHPCGGGGLVAGHVPSPHVPAVAHAPAGDVAGSVDVEVAS